MNHDIKICVPYYNLIEEETQQGIYDLLDSEEIKCALLSIQGTNIANTRNTLVNENKSDMKFQKLDDNFTHYLFIDADVVPTVEAVQQLLEYDLDIVSAAYKSREQGYSFVGGIFKNDDDGNFRDALKLKSDSEGLMEVDWVGGGCILIKKGVFENTPFPWFNYPVKEINVDGVIHRKLIFEDVGFCMNVKDAGYNIYIDCDTQVKHLARNYNNDILLLEIGLQVQCNFRCPYCISEQEDHWSNLTALNDDILSFVTDSINDDVLVALTGGEPLLWDRLETLIRSNPNKLFMISSNISKLIEHSWLVSPTKDLVDRVCFRIGWHPNVRNDIFLDNINIIKDAGYHYVVNYMVDGIDRENGRDEHIQFLIDNDIVFEISAEEDEDAIRHTDDKTSAQFFLPNFIDNKKFLRINSNGNIYDCYVGNPNGRIDDGVIDFTYKNDKIYCGDCIGLKGYTKILSQWDKFDFSTLFPTSDRLKYEELYNVFLDKTKYINMIDDDDARNIITTYKYKG